MKKACKTVFCAVAILLFGILSQQETKAGETSERHYSRTYSVLSVNVGNFYPPPGRSAGFYKLQPGPDEKKVISGIKNLKPKPDILILIEAYDKDQVLRICNSEAEFYSVFGGPYDFICVKKDIGDVIKHEQMPEDGSYEKYKGNSVGYVDVGLKDEGGRKVRIFYAHFPSPQLKWVSGLGWVSDLGQAEHKAHVSAFGWIEANITRAGSAIPCLIAGDLNNDFIRQRDENKYWSGKYIYEQVNKLNLWLLNPLSLPLQLKSLDGSTEQNYEPTWRLPEEVWKTTIDWVMGKFCVPPFLAPGSPKTDLATGTTGTIRTNFVTSPPDWWKDEGVTDLSRLTFDHKPLYGKVVFFWEGRVQEESVRSDILATYISEKPAKRLLVLKKDNTFFFTETARWEYRSNFYWCYSFPSQRHESEDGVFWEKGNEQIRQIYLPGGETGERFSHEDIRHIIIHKDGEIISNWSGIPETIIFVKEKDSELITETPGKLWSKYVNCDGNFLEFRKDGTYIRTYAVGTWGVLGNFLVTIPTVHDLDDHLDYQHDVGKDNIHQIEGDKLFWGYTGTPGILDKGDRSRVFVSVEPNRKLQTNWDSPNELVEKLKQANKFNPAKKDVFPPAGALVFFSGLREYKETGYTGVSIGGGQVIHAYQTTPGSTLGKMAWIDAIEEIEDEKFIADSYLGWAYPPGEWYRTSATAKKDIAAEERDKPKTEGNF